MAFVKQHPGFLFISFSLVLVAFVCALLLDFGTAPAIGETAPEEPAQIDSKTYTTVLQLRKRLCLRNADLAAMGCDEATSRAVLTSLLRWVELNQQNLDDARQESALAQKQLHKAQRAARSASRDYARLDSVQTLQQDYIDSLSSERELVESVIPAIESCLTTDQGRIWQIARTHNGLPGPYRYIENLRQDEVRDIQQAVNRSHRKAAIAAGQAARLDLPNREMVSQAPAMPDYIAADGVRSNISQFSQAATRAESEVLPRPESNDPSRALIEAR